MNKRERLFFFVHQSIAGHMAVAQPGSMAFFRNGRRTRYQPDFYCAECGVHFEVVGSRQAFHRNRVKIALFCEAYPAIRLKYVAPDGSDYDTNRPHRNGYPRKWADPFPRKCLDYREKAVERLQRAIALSPISVSVMAGIIGVSENVVRYVTDGVHLPHPKTARLIHEYLDSIELETKSA